jgi:Ca2+-binding RTX toxin-like protein
MKKGTRRGVLMLASILLMLVVVVGVAWAATRTGDNGPNTINGSPRNDLIHGLGGNDKLNGQLGADDIYGEGKDKLVEGPLRKDHALDELLGGKGNDILISRNKPASRDFVRCGPGIDTWVADFRDRSFGSRCERVRVP